LANGSGYTSVPRLVFDPPPSGERAKGTAVMGLNTFIVTNGGSGYTSVPQVTVSTPPGGVAAVLTATIANGAVTSVYFDLNTGFPGLGYTSLPPVTISGGGGSGAKARAQDMLVMDVTVTDNGSGYPCFTDSAALLHFTGGGGSGAIAFADGNCGLQGVNATVAVKTAAGLVDYAAGGSSHIYPDGTKNYLAYLLTDAGGSWHLWDTHPQVDSPLNLFDMQFRGASNAWIAGQLMDANLHAYLEHFDGTQWSEVGGTLPVNSFLNSISIRETETWVVGATYNPNVPTQNAPLVMVCR
jgi:hypothetical protein